MLLTQHGQRNLAGKLPHAVPVYIYNTSYSLIYPCKAEKKARQKENKPLRFLRSRKVYFFFSPLWLKEITFLWLPPAGSMLCTSAVLRISHRLIPYWHLTHYTKSRICRLILTSDKKLLLCGQQSAMLFIVLPDWKILLTFIPNSYTFITTLVLGICGTLGEIQMLFLDPVSNR